jgi:CRP/FNR family transcriptional regulator
VSRTLSAFNEIGLITVDQRSIGICDADALRTLRRLPPSTTRNRQAAGRKNRTASVTEEPTGPEPATWDQLMSA